MGMFISLTIVAQAPKKIVSKGPGSLSGLIKQSELTTITSLQVSGSMDARDFVCIRKMSKLKRLDLSAVSIEAYRGVGGTALGADTIEYQCCEIPQMAFSDLGGTAKCDSLRVIYLPAELAAIGYAAFTGCSRLTEVYNTGKLIAICEMAFQDCSSLKKFTLGPTLKYVQSQAFQRCGLESLTFSSESLDALDATTFYFCSKLKQITVLSAAPVKFNVPEGLFLSLHADLDKLVVSVPKGTKAMYASDPNWMVFKNLIER